ncbi:MAG: patatin-like phospholipase family protein [Rhodoblastus sp.]
MNKTPTGFVFAGGGSLGAVQVGMLRALLEAGVHPDFVVGASVGAINSAYFAGAPDLDGVSRLEKIWSGLKRADIFPMSAARMFGLLRHPDYIMDLTGLRRLIETHLGFRNFEDARVPLHVMATDQQGMSVRLSSGPLIEAILASAAVPGVFPTVQIAGRHLMDGAIAANTPLRLAVELGAMRIIVLPTGYACALQKPPKGVIGRTLHAITLLIAWQLMQELEALPEEIQVHMAPALCPLDVSPYDFSAAPSLIERATAETRRWIAKGGLDRRARASELSAHRH